MKLRLKFNLFSLLLLTALTSLVLLAGNWVLSEIIYESTRRVMSEEVRHKVMEIEQAHDTLRKAGVDHVEGYLQAAERELAAAFNRFKYGRSGQLFIFAGEGERQVYPTDANAALPDTATLAAMRTRGGGVIEYTAGDGDRFCAFGTVGVWNWLVGLSLTSEEMYARRADYLRKVGLLLATALVCNILLSSLFVGRLVGRVRPSLDMVARAEKGDLSARIAAPASDDELGGLQRGINAMLAERERAEKRLAEVNLHLEQLVAERAGALADKALELERANARLLELDRLKSAFLAAVSHELRTPLTSVLGFAKLIRKDFTRAFEPLAVDRIRQRKAERITSNLDVILQEGHRLTRLINDVLDLAKIEDGRVVWRNTRVSPVALVDRAAQAVRDELAAKPQVRLVTDLPADLPDIVVDPDQLQQVLHNLLDNAVKFTDTGEVRNHNNFTGTLKSIKKTGQIYQVIFI